MKSLCEEQIFPLANPRLQSIPFSQDAIPREILGLENNCLNSASAPGRGTAFPLRFSLLLPGCLQHHQKFISSWSRSWMACPLGIHWGVEYLDWGKEHSPGLLSSCHFLEHHTWKVRNSSLCLFPCPHTLISSSHFLILQTVQQGRLASEANLHGRIDPVCCLVREAKKSTHKNDNVWSDSLLWSRIKNW